MLDTIWREARRRIRGEVPEKDYETWIEPLRAGSWESGVLTLEAPSGFFRDWLRRNFLAELEAAVRAAGGEQARVVLVVNRAIDVPARKPIAARRPHRVLERGEEVPPQPVTKEPAGRLERERA